MPGILVILVWAATILNCISTFLGFQIALEASSVLGEVVCVIATFLVIGMALASPYILNTKVQFRQILQLIWAISLLVGFLCALCGNFSIFSLTPDPQNEFETGFLAKYFPNVSFVKGVFITFLTAACAYLSIVHSTLPDGGGRILRLYKQKDPDNGK